ncbi:adenosylcobinamide-phosphate synthase CbiB [Roseibacterium sp. SDUM158016]|uniref:adenosylcobinamide-phosphate synthase CbiB n=1 Tax=Roseicyclus sediminis TaxID=2980997 RepID=UPI0021D1DB41|nr:adenosylcobinamide-phosphate synthase CbiB [Roseibacterium sp. SDUM158016]MCU4652164.1 adenosylcobinamide-phosphate synthase CbiB [Roseibacterium sp. SDUM158016]
MSDHAVLLLVALLLDAVFGEPEFLWNRLPHPAVLMGRAVGWCDTQFNRDGGRRAKGVAVMLGLCLGAVALGAGLAALPGGAAIEVIGAAILLAQKSLAEHVGAVADGLRASLDEGRRAVSMIVGRDTAALDEGAVARAAVESAAENLSDGVVAPAFWFLVGGLPGIILYKIVNTADSMIGHRTERHEAFGWAAARLDDVLNWIPARITALLIALTHGSLSALRRAAAEGPLHRSVNAGWPEAAMASVLGLALSGPRSYGGAVTSDPVLNPEGRREATPGDIDAAVSALWRVWGGVFLTTVIFALS